MTVNSVWCAVSRLRLPFVALLVVAILLGGCATYPKARVDLGTFAPAERARVEQNLAVFYRVWDLVNRKHYEPKNHGVDWEHAAVVFGPRAATAPDEKSLYAVINEMLDELHDSHTHALTPEQAAERRTHQKFRTGFSLLRIEDRWVVSDVLPSSPAALAGVQRGWIVVERDGEPIGDRPDFTARDGEVIRWRFIDSENRPVDLSLVARRLSTAPLQIDRDLGAGIVYLRFDEFDFADRHWLHRELVAHAQAPAVIVDLRRNPGGGTPSLGVAVGEFFDRPVECGTFVSRHGAKSVEESTQFLSAHYRGKVVILVDAGTASAAEIFTAVLKFNRRATVVGRKTAGAVLASWFPNLPDGGELQLSEEDYVAPDGHRLEGNGIEPDLPVKQTLAEVRAGRDADVDMAMRILTGKPVGSPTGVD